jgi:hypothetical protein
VGSIVGGGKERKRRGKKGQKLEKQGDQGDEDEGHTSSPRGTHKEAVKHHEGCSGETIRVLVRASLRREKQKVNSLIAKTVIFHLQLYFTKQ